MVKKENCKDCYGHGLCQRHRAERLKVAYERLTAAGDLIKASHGCYGLTEYGKARQVLLDILNEPSKPDFTMDCPYCDFQIVRIGKILVGDIQDEMARHFQEKHQPTWSVHNCNSQAHVKCLAEAEKTKDASGYGTIFMGDLPEPLLNITQVKELLDNLELSGFSHGEAMAIVLKVVGRG